MTASLTRRISSMRSSPMIFAVSATLARLVAVSEGQVACPTQIDQAKEILARKGGLRADGAVPPPRALAGVRAENETIAGIHWTGKLVRASRLVQEAEAALLELK